MLTRLKVTGFKNLLDVDLRFGPFTCISGGNGAGKSNLFDAISFLGSLADTSLINAARTVRDEGGRALDILNLFHRVGEESAAEMSFEAEMIVPERGFDDLGQEVKAKITFLRYCVTIGYRRGDMTGFDGLELLHEDLSHITLGSASRHLLFPHKIAAWRHSAVKGRRSGGAFISTQGEGKGRFIELHTDGEGGGRPRMILASSLPRTILSTVNTAEYPTALIARREMQSWRQMRLDPKALRLPDELAAESRVGKDGSHLAATLHRLEKMEKGSGCISADSGSADSQATGLYPRLAGLLREFGTEVGEIKVDHDERRGLLSILLTAPDGTSFTARALSDGALRYLALAVIALDLQTPALICLEEPENGVCPERIPALLKVLQDTAVDVNRPVGPGNPLRQVIITTHSPALLSLVPDDSLIVADVAGTTMHGRRFNSARFAFLSNTWRHDPLEGAFTIDRERRQSCPDPKPHQTPEQCNVERGKKVSKSSYRGDGSSSQMQPSLPYGE